MSIDDTSHTDPPEAEMLDMQAINADRETGIKSIRWLRKHRGKTFKAWYGVLIGLRAMREVATERSGTNDVRRQAHRDAVSDLLKTPEWRIYNDENIISRGVRSAAYKMMDHLQEIYDWYDGLPPADQDRWNHPETIIKHCPQEYLKEGEKAGKKAPTKKKSGKKPAVSAETERLKHLILLVLDLLIQLAKRHAKFEPEFAAEMEAKARTYYLQVVSLEIPDDDIPTTWDHSLDEEDPVFEDA